MILVFSCYCCNLWCHNKPKFLGDRYHSWCNFLFVDSYFVWPSMRVCFATFHYCKGLFLFWCWEYKSIKISTYFWCRIYNLPRKLFDLLRQAFTISFTHSLCDWLNHKMFFTVSVFLTLLRTCNLQIFIVFIVLCSSLFYWY